MPFSSGTYAGCIDFFDFCRIRCLFSEILPPEASISAFSRGFDAFSSGFFHRKHQFPYFLAVSMLFLRDSSSKSINSYDFRSFRCFSPGHCFRLEPRLILQTLGHNLPTPGAFRWMKYQRALTFHIAIILGDKYKSNAFLLLPIITLVSFYLRMPSI